MYYILYKLDNLEVVHKDTKPLKPQDMSFYGIAEYHKQLPNNDWLTVANIRDENSHIVCDLVAHFFPKTEPTEKQKAQTRIQILKQKLAESDYQAIKYAEGWLTEEAYAPIRRQRQEYRKEINQLELIVEG